MLQGVLLALFAVLISSFSQVLLKRSAQMPHDSLMEEYLNWRVIVGYMIFVGASLCSTLAYRTIPLSMGPILDATGYFYVTIFGIFIFHEHIDYRKFACLLIIIVGIALYSSGL